MKTIESFLFKVGIMFFLLNILINFSCHGNTETPPPPPINDECSGAFAITVDTICNYVTYSNVGATASAGVPAPGCADYIGADVWFSVTVPPSGHLVFDSYSQGIGDAGMAIYSANCGSLALMTCNAYSNFNNTMPQIDTFGLIPGSTIYIRFWENGSIVGGDFALCVYDPPIPINDECFGAITLIPDTFCNFSIFTTAGASASMGVTDPGCANYQGGDVWFRVIVPSTGRLIFDSQNQGIGNAGMAIYAGSCGSLSLLNCDNYSSFNLSMPLIYQTGMTAGSTIYIRFWRYNNPTGGKFGLCVYEPPIPINDEWSGATLINVDTVCNYTTYTNLGATASAGLPTSVCGNYLCGDVWFKLIVPASGTLIFSTQNIIGSILSCGMAVYYGNGSSLFPIECKDGAMPKITCTGLIPTYTIYIRVWRYHTINGGSFGLCVYNPSPPSVQPPCSNLGFENNFTGWYGTVGNSVPGAYGAPTPDYKPALFNTTTNPNFSLMTGGTDPFAGFPVVFNGSASLRLGDSALMESYNAASIEQSFMVTASNTNFTYNYAVVLENGNHPYTVQSFFQIDLYDPNGFLIPCGQYTVALPNSEFLPTAYQFVYYKPWTPVSINLSAYIGQKVKIRFTASDCTARGHFGYAYIDCSCTPWGIIAADTICQGQSVTLSAPLGALSYLWLPGGDTTSSIIANPNNSTNFSCSMATLGNTSCNYTLTKFITVKPAPQITAGSNSPICNGQTLFLTSTDTSISNYSWTGPDGFTSLVQNPVITAASSAASGIYTVTTNYSNACTRTDSIMVIVSQPINSTYPLICQGQTYIVGMHLYSTSGIYHDTLTSNLGCDSIIVTNLTVGAILNTTFNPIICQGEVFNVGTHNYILAGTYIDTLATSYGCDSIVTTNLSLSGSVQQTSINPVICQGETFTVGIHNYISSGTFKDTLISFSGCDSIITTHLTVNPIQQIILHPTFCPGGSVSVGIHNYTQTGTYQDTLITYLGCDSIITTNLVVHPINQIVLNPVICGEDAFFVGTHGYYLSGTYHDTLQSSFGCDSMITTNLTVLPQQLVNLYPVLCQGQTFTVGFHIYSTTGTYCDSLLTSFGCDSIIITHLIVLPTPLTPTVSQSNNVLSSNITTGNQWYNQNGLMIGDTNQTLILTTNGDYYVIVTQNACVSDTSNVLHITNVGIEENKNHISINIYPNPVTNELIIEAIGNNEKIEFEILSSIGKLIFKGSLIEKTIVQTKNFAQGMYMVKIANEKLIEFKKVVKN